MDKIADEVINNSNASNHVYKMHDTLDVVCVNSTNNNNNNNEKMDDANQTTAAGNQKFTNSMRQDSTNSDFSPLTDSIQMNADERHMNSIEFRADDEYSLNDNQSNTSDEATDNNSTDNISFSEDIVENIIVLPNNFLSDDESTNSDDVVYAYRGFEPAQVNVDDVNADEETDYLEMDFEPDPASEIEQEPNQSIEPSCSHIANLPPPNAHNTISNTPNNETGASTLSDLNIERTGVHKNWLAPIEVRQDGIYKEANPLHQSHRGNRNGDITDNGSVNMHTANNNKLDINADSIEMESNKSLETKRNAIKLTETSIDGAYSAYYDNTVSLSTKKYTGTIPKTTSKFVYRPSKSKTSADFPIGCNGLRFESQASGSAHCSLDMWSTSSNQVHKRSKTSNQEKPTSSTSICDNLGDISVEADKCFVKRPNGTARSMSFPNEDLSNQRMPSATGCAVMCMPLRNEREMENDVEQPASVTFESTYCTVDTIVNALVSYE